MGPAGRGLETVIRLRGVVGEGVRQHLVDRIISKLRDVMLVEIRDVVVPKTRPPARASGSADRAILRPGTFGGSPLPAAGVKQHDVARADHDAFDFLEL